MTLMYYQMSAVNIHVEKLPLTSLFLCNYVTTAKHDKQ